MSVVGMVVRSQQAKCDGSTKSSTGLSENGGISLVLYISHTSASIPYRNDTHALSPCNIIRGPATPR
jgi:hypothetical protein